MGALAKVETGKLEPAQASARATLARAIVAVRQSNELEERLVALEEKAGIRSA